MTTPRPRRAAAEVLSAAFLSPSDLRDAGVNRHLAADHVRNGHLLRLRNGRYADPALPDTALSAGRLGGRLDCVSLLQELDVFVHGCARLHIQLEPGTARLPPRGPDVVAHWRTTARPRGSLVSDLIEALAQSVRCQPPRHAVATLDSAWNRGLLDEFGVNEVFALLPRRYRPLRPLLDPASESGPETLLRLILRSLGCVFEPQVVLPGVGRVDFVVDGWLIIECDSRAHHGGWDQQKRDRRRDLAAAGLGYTTIRPFAEQIMHAPDALRDQLAAVLAHRLTRRPQNSVERSSRRG